MKLIIAIAVLWPMLAHAEESTYEWQQRQDLENRIETLEAAQRAAEMADRAEAARKREAAHQAYLQSSYGQ